MLTQGESVEAHALRERGWSVSAIARHLKRDRKTVRYPELGITGVMPRSWLCRVLAGVPGQVPSALPDGRDNPGGSGVRIWTFRCLCRQEIRYEEARCAATERCWQETGRG